MSDDSRIRKVADATRLNPPIGPPADGGDQRRHSRESSPRKFPRQWEQVVGSAVVGIGVQRLRVLDGWLVMTGGGVIFLSDPDGKWILADE